MDDDRGTDTTADGGSVGDRDRREDLLAAAARRFVAVGTRKTTMEDIAREARAGKATLYRYFPNKDAVIDALLAREADRLDNLLVTAAAAHDDAADRVEDAFLVALRFLVDHPVLAKGRTEEPAVLLPRLTADGAPLLQRGLARFTALIEEGVAAGDLRRVDPPAAAEVVMRLLLSYVTFPHLHVHVEREEDARAYARALVAGGLRARR